MTRKRLKQTKQQAHKKMKKQYIKKKKNELF